MSKTKLEKVNERLYLEPFEDGKRIRWNKRFHRVFLTLNDIHVKLCLNIHWPKTSAGTYPNETEEEKNTENKTAGANQPTTPEADVEVYSQHFGWMISATGCLENDRLGVIQSDGTNSSLGQDFNNLDVSLDPVADSKKENARGTIYYSDANYEQRAAYISLNLQVPEIQLEKICNELLSGRINTIKLRVDIDSFESELDYSLWEPPMPKRFYIEQELIWNSAYLLDLIGSHSSVGETSPQVPDNKS